MIPPRTKFASIVKTTPGVVIVVDLLFKSIDTETKSVVLNLFQPSEPRIKLVRSEQQNDTKDCGIFSIAMVTAIALEHNPSNVTFHQELKWARLTAWRRVNSHYFHDAIELRWKTYKLILSCVTFND